MAIAKIEAGSPAFWRATLALSLGSVMVFSNIYLPQPLLPMLIDTFAVSKLQANWVLTITTLTLALSLLVYGLLSDALGRKRLMVVSMIGLVIVTACLAVVDSYPALLVMRALQGVCLGGLPAIAIAYMGDEFSKKALVTAVGFYIAANTIGGIGGRLAGGYLGQEFGLQGAFIVMALWSLGVLLLFIWLLPPSRQFERHPVQTQQILKAVSGHLGNPVLWVAYLVGGLNFLVFMNQYSFITFVLAAEPFNLSPFWIGLLFLTYLSGTLASMLSGKLAHYIPQSLGMALGILVFMLGTVTTLGEQLLWIVLGFFLNSFGFFLCHSLASSWVSRHAQHNRASASSLYLVAYYLGGSLGGLYLSPFWEWLGWLGVVLGSLGVLLVTLLACVYLYRVERGALETVY